MSPNTLILSVFITPCVNPTPCHFTIIEAVLSATSTAQAAKFTTLNTNQDPNSMNIQFVYLFTLPAYLFEVRSTTESFSWPVEKDKLSFLFMVSI